MIQCVWLYQSTLTVLSIADRMIKYIENSAANSGRLFQFHYCFIEWQTRYFCPSLNRSIHTWIIELNESSPRHFCSPSNFNFIHLSWLLLITSSCFFFFFFLGFIIQPGKTTWIKILHPINRRNFGFLCVKDTISSDTNTALMLLMLLPLFTSVTALCVDWFWWGR